MSPTVLKVPAIKEEIAAIPRPGRPFPGGQLVAVQGVAMEAPLRSVD